MLQQQYTAVWYYDDDKIAVAAAAPKYLRVYKLLWWSVASCANYCGAAAQQTSLPSSHQHVSQCYRVPACRCVGWCMQCGHCGHTSLERSRNRLPALSCPPTSIAAVVCFAICVTTACLRCTPKTAAPQVRKYVQVPALPRYPEAGCGSARRCPVLLLCPWHSGGTTPVSETSEIGF